MPEEPQEYELPEGYGVPEPVPYIPYVSSPRSPNPPPSPSSEELNASFPIPPALPSSSPIPIVLSTSPTPKRSHSRLWITISIIIVLLLSSVATFFIVNYVTRLPPGQTLDTFCAALQRGDYQSAYDQFSKRLQSTFSEATFATALSRDKVTACTHGAPDESGNSATTDLKLVHASKGVNTDIVTLTVDSKNNWKIDNFYRQT